ncbi:protein tramtrack, beta isoform isoform X6 [Eurytemora carolleeae]|uniref:protein tramtrack, beta isoform isoform X6 n=1 Tax=Eurytemora carolleeae TaxID=1294199 RepID=UPI000C75CE1E|nr:protein tramtrack, beta isoform isoform X6 [Eurytemora carolleeae]|eukprot:XP_023319805.1 protein tramtrack, beta isoform-like isoform X6 [Eurytemora affinis]
MGTSEKFCLRWNDFETNISVAFRELREEKDFFDVTLACDDSSQIQAHKVILSACSPFFRNVLRKNPHQHPLLYLKGVKYKEMLSVLNFMYMGEVNVAQEELNSFLAVAEDLRVKGLTQNNAESGDKTKAESKSNSNRNREPPEREPGPPPKRARPVPSAPSTPAPTNNRPSSYEDDDIQEVVPVKSEPRDVTTPSTAMTTSSNNDYQDSSLVEPGQGQVALEDSYQDDSYDYGNYEEGYDDGSGMIDPNTGMPIAAGADGNKGREKGNIFSLNSLINAEPTLDDQLEVKEYLIKIDGTWFCQICEYSSKQKGHVTEHVESLHLKLKLVCPNCNKIITGKSSFRSHKRRCF